MTKSVQPSDVLDLDTASQLLDGDRELLESMIRLLAEEAPRLMAEVEEAYAGGDSALLSRRAHSLKGSVANLAAERTRAAAESLELASEEGREAEIGRAIERLREEMRLLMPVLEELAPRDR